MSFISSLVPGEGVTQGTDFEELAGVAGVAGHGFLNIGLSSTGVPTMGPACFPIYSSEPPVGVPIAGLLRTAISMLDEIFRSAGWPRLSAASSSMLAPRPCTAALPLKAGLRPPASRDDRLLALCCAGEGEASSKLCPLNECGPHASTSWYLLCSMIESILARRSLSIMTANRGFRSRRSASARPLFAIGKQAS